MSYPMIYYTTSGPVWGFCGHRHREIRTALECLDRNRAGCQEQGGYSDRCIMRVNEAEGIMDRVYEEAAREYHHGA